MNERIIKMLRKRRNELGLTQNALSELSGVPARTIRHWESHGADMARAGDLAKVCAALGIAVEDALAGTRGGK